MHVTIKDVANLAGVSIATVSHVINRNVPVRKDTEEKVLRAMKQLNFSLDLNARSLRQKQTKIVGMVISDVSNQFFGQLAKAIEQELSQNGYGLLLANSDGSSEKEKDIVAMLLERRVDGLILVPAGDDGFHLSPYINNGTPIVLVDRSIPGLDLDVISVNNLEATEQVVDHLIADGFRRIGFISGKKTSTVSAERMEGYINSLKKNNLLIDDNLIVNGDFDVTTGYRAVNEMMGLPDPPDAILACNNLIAVGVLQALMECGRYPDIDVAVWDQAPWMSILKPELYAVIQQPIGEIGKKVVDTLLGQLRDPDAKGKKGIRFNFDVSIRFKE